MAEEKKKWLSRAKDAVRSRLPGTHKENTDSLTAGDFSPEFIRNREVFEMMHQFLNHLEEEAKEYTKTGMEHIASAKRMHGLYKQFLDMKEVSDAVPEEYRIVLEQSLNSITDGLESMMTNFTSLFETIGEELSRDMQAAVVKKSLAFTTHSEKESSKQRVQSLLQSSGMEAATKQLLVAQRTFQDASEKFSSAEREATHAMINVEAKVGFTVLERLGMMVGMQMNYHKECALSAQHLSPFLMDFHQSIGTKRREFERDRKEREEEIQRLDTLSQSRQGVMDPEVFEKALSHFQPPSDLTRIEKEGVILNIPKVVHLNIHDGATCGVLFCTTYRLVFKPYINTLELDIHNAEAKDSDSASQTDSEIDHGPGGDHDDYPVPPASCMTWGYFSLPLMSISRLENVAGGNGIMAIWCKDLQTFTLSFRHTDYDVDRVINDISPFIWSVDNCFAFYYQPTIPPGCRNGWDLYDPRAEFSRMGVPNNYWRFTDLNINYELCPTYPSVLVVPNNMSDEILREASAFRSKHRFPVLVWTKVGRSVAMLRSSQPMTGIIRSQNAADQQLLQEIINSSNPRGMHVYDARPVANAVGNVAMGGGFEKVSASDRCELEFLGIENIHVMRDSLVKLRGRITSDLGDTRSHVGIVKENADDETDADRPPWLRHVSIVIRGALEIANKIHSGTSVLVHCSDGWDRTAQLTCISQLLLDPYYRTVEGFLILIEKEWLSFGHKFGQRCGHSSERSNFMDKQRSPIFIQFLECVWQIMKQFPPLFEFNECLLRVLFCHVHSCLYGTFLFNSERERVHARLSTRTPSLWTYILHHHSKFRSPDYVPGSFANSIPLVSPDYVRTWPLYIELWARSNTSNTRITSRFRHHLQLPTSHSEGNLSLPSDIVKIRQEEPKDRHTSF